MITTFQAAIPKKQIAPSTFEAALNARVFVRLNCRRLPVFLGNGEMVSLGRNPS